MSNLIKNKIVRTRYAPSPTGLFHIGGARTALFNYLFAKKNNGDFVVRIEDTDIERNVEGGAESQLNNLKWLKIFPDESLLNPGNYGPYKQTEKLSRYKDLAIRLLEEKKAYRCFCSTEKLEIDRKEALQKGITPKYNRTCLKLTEEQIKENLKNNLPYSIRLKINDKDEFKWDDIVRGQIVVPAYALTDPVILKSNGYPMYNFAVVIDDYDMKITHIIRGEEHISNTPYQIAIKNSLGFKNEISFGHLSLIIDETGKKLSKRNIELKQFIEDYKNMGFTPEAICNFMYLLGMSANENHEIFDMVTAIKNFDINKVSKSSTTFDFKKMEWISSEHFKLMNDTMFLAFVTPFIEINLNYLEDRKKECILLFKNQISYAKQINHLLNETFLEKVNLKKLISENEMLNVKDKDLLEFINLFNNKILESNEFNEECIKTIISILKEETGRNGKNLFMPLRLFATHRSHGPELAKTISLFGKNIVLENIKLLLKELSNKSTPTNDAKKKTVTKRKSTVKKSKK